MTTTDRIETLIKQGVITLTIGTSPNKMLFVQATQAVKTGPAGTHLQATHQAEDTALVGCLEQIAKQVEHANQLKIGNMITLPRGGHE